MNRPARQFHEMRASDSESFTPGGHFIHKKRQQAKVSFPIQEPLAPVARSYDPLPSVWFGEDSELLDKMLKFYPRKRPVDILDATVNGGRFWWGLDWKIIGMDIDPGHKPDVVGDNTNMPFDDASFDVIVYDPPHIPNQGKDRSKDFNTRFGLTLKSPATQGYNFAFMYPPFAREAFRVLRRKESCWRRSPITSTGTATSGAYRVHPGSMQGRLLCVRLHCQGAQRPDC